MFLSVETNRQRMHQLSFPKLVSALSTGTRVRWSDRFPLIPVLPHCTYVKDDAWSEIWPAGILVRLACSFVRSFVLFCPDEAMRRVALWPLQGSGTSRTSVQRWQPGTSVGYLWQVKPMHEARAHGCIYRAYPCMGTCAGILSKSCMWL